MGLVVFRSDASLEIGSGHIMRCRTLARALRSRGIKSVFLCRRQPGDLIALLEPEFLVLPLPEHLKAPLHSCNEGQRLSSTSLYATWLGCPEEQDAVESLAAMADAKLQPPTWLVVDHYGLGAPWQLGMVEGLSVAHGRTPDVLVLDDLADRVHRASVLMDANRLNPAAPDPYRHLVPETCTNLLGPPYALLDPLYPKLRQQVPARSHLTRVLVFFGGIDITNHAALTVEALSHPKLLHLAVDVVLGAAAPHRADVELRVSQRPNTTLHVGLPSLAGLMARADLAVGAAGTTSWERVCLGLPSLVVPLADNQKQGAQALEGAGVARCLNLQPEANTVEILREALLELVCAPDALQAMSEACLQLGDGWGLARVVTALLGPAKGLRLRLAEATDVWLYHWWANDPQVRLQSFNSEPISVEEHRRWFEGRLNSPLALLLVLEDGDGLPLGQIRFERDATDERLAVVSFSLDRLARGHGLASQLLELGLAVLARCWGHSAEVKGEVRANNPASCRAFLRAGFQEGPAPWPGVRCFSRSACPTA
jgi:UDP-2,4-diacetamido-2,4,6-trideoxy-beta-L-altropyranose hydrolase